MKIGLFSLRAEHRFSGEYKSTLSTRKILAELGADVAYSSGDDAGHADRFLGLHNFVDRAKFAELSGAIANRTYDWYLIKIPTVAQLPLVRLAVRGRAAKVVVILDSVSSSRPSRGSLWRELRHEPAYALGKRLLNRRIWGKIGGWRPRGCLGCSAVQVEEARTILGESVRYWTIPNTSLGGPDTLPAPRPSRPLTETVTIGYLGPPSAYKGCLEVIEAAAYLPPRPGFRFKAAFNRQGSERVRQRWQRGGGEIQEIVQIDDFLCSIDILCVPLYAEYGTKVFPNLMLEAIHAGVPLLTTRLPVFVELLGNDTPLPLLSRVTAREIAASIKHLLLLDPEKVTKSLKNRSHQFSLQQIRENWRCFLQDLGNDH